MKNTRNLLATLMSLVLVVMLAACSKGPALKLEESTALDLIWGYEMHLIDAVKEANPAKFVTGLEQQWLDERLAKKAAGEPHSVGWMTGGSTIKVDKVTSQDAEIKLQMETDKGYQTVTFKLVPVNGEWKIANHTTADGKWWAPAK